MQHILVLGDQLNLERFDTLAPSQTRVLMIESLARGRLVPYHKQKLVLLYSAMRHFRLALEARGFEVFYAQTDTFEQGFAAYFEQFGNVKLEVMQPAEFGVAEQLEQLVQQLGGQLEVTENSLWLSTQSDWARYAKGKNSYRMEFFYRQMRQKTNWLMDGNQPIGGQWNFDSENRQVPPKGHVFPAPLVFVPDEITQETIQFVEQHFADHFGDLAVFNWVVTREQALNALQRFLEHRLALFGAYEDAMVESEAHLYHSLLSPALNLGLLSAKEVCLAALEYQGRVPLASLEGFIRQILGWREFMRHIYNTFMPEFRETNYFGFTTELPDFYWTAKTKMHCVATTVTQIQDSGHAHHIQRLMVLGNLALLLGVRPQAINHWFLVAFVDAFDWVVSPNVLGMSQYADGGRFTSKPYVSGAGYINRMSNYCLSCVYNPKLTVGDKACPFNSLYWHFIDKHSERWKSNPRMSLMLANWAKRDANEKQQILEQAKKLLENLL